VTKKKRVLHHFLQTNNHNLTEAEYKSDFFDKYSMPDSTQKLDCPWIYKSLYSCKICSKIILGKEQFKTHLVQTHSKAFSSYLDEHVSAVFKERFHICLFEGPGKKPCLKRVLWDGRAMAHHLSKHGLTPKEYRSSFMSESKDKVFERIASEERKEWLNKCTFLCKVCNKIFDTKNDLFDHARDQCYKKSCPYFTNFRPKVECSSFSSFYSLV
jgi:Zinc-finger of C2H2 type